MRGVLEVGKSKTWQKNGILPSEGKIQLKHEKMH